LINRFKNSQANPQRETVDHDGPTTNRTIASLGGPSDQYLQHKLSFEWKNIYRRIKHTHQNQVVPAEIFNSACVHFGVLLSAQEIAKLKGADGKIDILQVG